MKHTIAILSAVVFALCASTSQVHAQTSDARVTAPTPTSESGSVPRLIQFSATLKDATQRPVTGVASVTFAIYADQENGVALWSETQNVLADSTGHYNVLLGAATASGGVPAELFATGQSRWLGVTIARQPEQARILLASVPYALKAGDADTLGGLPASSYVTTQQLAARTGAAAPSTTILATPELATAAAPVPAAAQNQNAIPQTGVDVTGAGTADYIPLWTSSSNIANSILFQSASKIGVGTTTPVVTLDVNGDSIFRGSFQLVPQGTATASTGQLSHSYQWEASTYDSSTKAAVTTAFGFRATPQGNNTANPTSSLDLYYGPGGGTLTDTGFSISNSGLVTFVPGQTFNGATENLTDALNLPITSTSGAGVISFGGNTFINDFGGITNTFVGVNAGPAFLATNTGNSNSGFGMGALLANTTGNLNTAIGTANMPHNTQGSGNTSVGYLGLESHESGDFNTSLGALSGAGNVSGSDDTFVGYASAATADPLTNATAIGNYAAVGASNSLVLGSINGVNGAKSSVNVGIGTATPRSALELSAATFEQFPVAAPILTLTNTAGGKGNSVALDFNTYAPSTSGTYNPSFKIAISDNGDSSNNFGFYTNTPGAHSNGLEPMVTMTLSGGMVVYGNLNVQGTLSKAGGSFKIDDPIDPAGKYLSHSFVESPDMMNIYNGSVILDSKGTAVVEMPKWFDALNRDFQYQLTAVGAPGPKLYVAEKMHDNHFRIAGGKKGQEISWQVTGIRHDAWANAHRIPNEEEKPANEQGKYMHPELFGAGPDKAIAAAHGPATNAAVPASTAAPAPTSPTAANSASHTADGQR